MDHILSNTEHIKNVGTNNAENLSTFYAHGYLTVIVKRQKSKGILSWQ